MTRRSMSGHSVKKSVKEDMAVLHVQMSKSEALMAFTVVLVCLVHALN